MAVGKKVGVEQEIFVPEVREKTLSLALAIAIQGFATVREAIELLR